MSLKIQEPQAAVIAASPVDAVSLSERVQARQPQPTAQQAAERTPEPTAEPTAEEAPEQSPFPGDVAMWAPDESDRDVEQEWARDSAPLPQREVHILATAQREGGRDGQDIGQRDRRGMAAQAQAAAAAPVLPAITSRPLPTVASPAAPIVPGNEPAALLPAAVEGSVPSGAKAPAATAPSSATANLHAASLNGGAVTDTAEKPGPAAASAQAATATTASALPSRVQPGQGERAVRDASPGAPVSAGMMRTAPARDVPVAAAAPEPSPELLPAAGRPAATDLAQAAAAAGATVMPQPHAGEAAPDTQAMADARRAEANLGTRQHVRAVRQAEALQTAMAQRADTASHFNVSFKSWGAGAGHSVSGRVDGNRLVLQPTSARVGQALSSALAPPGAELQIAVESSDSATDERRRRGGQGHA
ncbi:SpaN/EivJ family type III secretion system needle length determinant [Stenotrophomonas bentonitica]